jgi:pilus assembly protein Flp/PilA
MRSSAHLTKLNSTVVNCQSNFRLIEDSSGVTAIEYALIAALIAVAAIAAFTLVGTNLSTNFSYIASQL